MNYNMKIFYKFLVIFFHHGFFLVAHLIAKKKEKIQSRILFPILPIHLIHYVQFKLDNYTNLVGLFVLFVKVIVGKFKKEKTYFVPISSRSFFFVKG